MTWLRAAVLVAVFSIHPLLTGEIRGLPGQAAAQTEAEKAAAAKAAGKNLRSYAGEFTAPVLADDAINELKIPVPPGNLLQLPRNPRQPSDQPKQVQINWKDRTATLFGLKVCSSADSHNAIRVDSKKAIKDDNENVILRVHIPPRPCWWPLTQEAEITVQGYVAGEDDLKTFFHETVSVSVRWIPLLVTCLVLALIYPGCALVAWFLAERRFKKGKAQQKPVFLASLDPVQITANQHGRASLAKLQIFGFSLLVFGLLLYFQLRCGLLSGLSTDVLFLMGISAAGAVGGKITYRQKRRLSSDVWSWLTERGWLPRDGDAQPRAKWRELVLDADGREFDPYSFQMAVFSLVVAIALLRSGLTGLEAFAIPPTLLGLLGLSQAVFVGGKAAEPSPYVELETKLRQVKGHEETYLTLSKDPAKETEAKQELERFKLAAKEAGEMFRASYFDQLPPNVVNQVAPNIVKCAAGQAPPIALAQQQQPAQQQPAQQQPPAQRPPVPQPPVPQPPVPQQPAQQQPAPAQKEPVPA